MTRKDIERIKQIIRTNFDRSVARYEEFEQKYELFGELTTRLAKDCGIRPGMRVADVGCGTGASTFVLAEILGGEGMVIGIDLSDGMLDEARRKMRIWDRKTEGGAAIEFRKGDAEKLHDCIEEKVDAVLYNATIFLVPNPVRSMEGAFEILREDGVVGLNYLLGISVGGGGWGERGGDADLFQVAKERKWEGAPYGRKIMDVELLPEMMTEDGFGDVHGGTINIKTPRQEIEDFYSIPAQSAGLYPKTPYEERLGLLDSLLNQLENKGIKNYCQRWGWNTGVK